MTTVHPPYEQAWLDQEDARVCDHIRRFGVSIQLIGGGTCSYPGCTGTAKDSPNFAYTVGLFGIGHPELAAIGLSKPELHTLVNGAARLVLGGGALLPAVEVSIDGVDRRVMVEKVPNPGDIAFAANRHYGCPSESSVPVLQLTYSDRRGRFPWDIGYTDRRRDQPRPGHWDAWR